MIDWMNPSEDILEAKRIGYEEGYEKGKEDCLESAEILDPLAEIERLHAQNVALRTDRVAMDKQMFLAGFIDGLKEYAWWKDGVQYVGTCGMTLTRAIDRAKEEARGTTP